MRKLLILLCLLVAASAGATTFYTAKTGNDSNNCTQAQSQSTPKLTINGGIACLTGGGDTLYVKAGTYVENINSGVASGTSWASYVRIAAFFPEVVTLKPSGGSYAVSFTGNEHYIELDGINIDAEHVDWDTVRVESWASGAPHHIRVKNATLYGTLTNNGTINSQPQIVLLSNTVPGRMGGNEIVHCTLLRGGGNADFAHAIYASSDDNLIDGNDVSDFLGAGIQVYHSGSPTPADNIIRNNVFHDSHINSGFRSWGILVQGDGHQVYNNVIHDLGNTTSYGIDIFAGGPEIYNNTVFSARNGLYIENESGSVIRNNIFYNNSISNYNANGFTPTADHNLTTDPSFISSGTDDYRLQNSSAAKDTGTNAGPGTTDIVGTARPQGGTYDIGAYEYGAAGPGGPSDVPATGTIVVTDTFTGTATTALVSHTGETGATWAIQTGSSAGMVIDDLNRLRLNTPDVDTFAYASGSPVSSQYDVRVEFHTFTTIADHTYLLWARMDTATRTGYFAMYNRVPATLELWVVLANAYTLLGQCSVLFPDMSARTVALEVRTGGQQLWYWETFTPANITQCVMATDTSVTATGKGGIAMYAPTAADANATGIHFDNFAVQDVVTSGGTGMCTKCRLRFVKP